jgi:hypothetical protein
MTMLHIEGPTACYFAQMADFSFLVKIYLFFNSYILSFINSINFNLICERERDAIFKFTCEKYKIK